MIEVSIRKVPIQCTNRFSACLDDIAATITAHYQRDYRLMYRDSWDFFSLSDDVDEDQVDQHKWDNLYNFHGARLVLEQAPFSQSLSRISQQIDNGVPAVIGFDGYYCDWDPYCGKTHNRHACIAVGLDLQAEEVLIVDPYFTKAEKRVSFHVLQQASEYFGEWQIQEAPLLTDWASLLREAVAKIEEKDMMSSIRKLADEITQLNMDELYDDLTDSIRRLYAYFNRLILGRMQFGLVMNAYSEHYREHSFSSWEAEFQRLATNWEVILNVISKALFAESFKHAKQEVEDRILAAADDEEAMLSRLKCVSL